MTTNQQRFKENLNTINLASLGFKVLTDTPILRALHPHAKQLMQLRVRDDKGKTLYSIFAEFYDFSDLPVPQDLRTSPVTFQANLYKSIRPEEPNQIRLDFYPVIGDTVEDVLAFFRQSYESLGCCPDPYND